MNDRVRTLMALVPTLVWLFSALLQAFLHNWICVAVNTLCVLTYGAQAAWYGGRWLKSTAEEAREEAERKRLAYESRTERRWADRSREESAYR